MPEEWARRAARLATIAAARRRLEAHATHEAEAERPNPWTMSLLTTRR